MDLKNFRDQKRQEQAHLRATVAQAIVDEIKTVFNDIEQPFLCMMSCASLTITQTSTNQIDFSSLIICTDESWGITDNCDEYIKLDGKTWFLPDVQKTMSDVVSLLINDGFKLGEESASEPADDDEHRYWDIILSFRE